MPYGTPVTSESAKYQVLIENNATDQRAVVSLTVEPMDSGWTQAGLDALFLDLLDLIDGASFLSPSASVEGVKSQDTNTTVTPTP